MKFKQFFPIIGIIILIYIIIKIEPQKIITEISNVNIYIFFIAGIFIFLSLITQMLKWFVIAKFQGMSIPFLSAFKINLIGFFYGFVTPAKVGNIVRADYLKKYNNGNLNPGITNFVLDKIFDLLSLILIVVIFCFVFKEIIPVNYFYFSFLFLIVFIIILIIFKNERRSRKIFRIFYIYLIPKKIKYKLKDGFHSFYQNIPSKKYFILFLLMNILNWVIIYLSMFLIGLSLGMKISFFIFLAICPIATLVGFIPITVSGIGTREAVLISLMGLFGVESVKVLSMSLLNIFVGGIIPSIITIFLIIKINNKRNERKSESCNSCT